MTRACVLLLADTDTHEAMGRMANARTSATEVVEAGDEAVVIFPSCSSSQRTLMIVTPISSLAALKRSA